MTLEVISPTEAMLDGRYVLQDRVGRGGMATVYRAEDTRLGRTVAIKMIHEGDGPESSIERAHTEKALLARLSHPSLVTLHDAQLDPGRPRYLVMEFVDGPTLAARMAQGPLAPHDVARLARDLAEGLAVVHGAGIMHRDVKPSNVLLSREDDRHARLAKLADFGIACALDNTRLTTPGIVLGTLTYMAPEQLRDADPGTPVDIFALGLVLIEALSGEPGYPALGSGRAAAVARLMDPPRISETVPEEWRDLLERMTRLEPEERPAADEVATAVRRILRGYAARGIVPASAVSAPVGSGAPVHSAPGSDAAAAAPAQAAAVSAGAAASAPAATPETPAPAATPATDKTAVIAPDAEPSAAPESGTEEASGAPRSSRIRRRVIAGAAGAVALGAVVAGVAFSSIPDGSLGRAVSAVSERSEPAPAEPVAEDTTPGDVAPVETVVEEKPGNGNQGDENPASNEGNSGKGDQDKGNAGNGNQDKGNSDKGKGPKSDDD